MMSKDFIIPSSIECEYKTLELLSLKIVEASPDAMIVIDRQGIIKIFNSRAELLFGCDRSDVTNKPIEILLPENLKDKHILSRSSWFRQPRTRQMGSGIDLLALHQQSRETFSVTIELSPIVLPSTGIYGLAVIRPKENIDSVNSVSVRT